ncbi:polyketide synthase [Collybia nuda]|uniref:Polyketide synthase n=1 Tax=Collybia nuda TaxID=64659 RepID=A0A9P5YE39_9AGAR|nr:polyketide synthase [Collybia nuda]
MTQSQFVLEPIAIVGISTEFPGGASRPNLDHHHFFEFLLNHGQAYEQIPRDRFNIDAWKGRNAGQIITDTGSFLKNTALFDHVEFGITATDAKTMALSTRKLIEHSFLALLDSGIDYRGRNVGSYMAGVAFEATTIADSDEFDVHGSFAGYPSMIANKVSYHLDLLGPSLPTDTACSSTLTAFHLAVQALRAGECEAAVVGGCQLNHRLADFIQYSQGSVLSPDGKCKPFDASANGFARGEGAAVVVLKPLRDALRDGDHIYASVLGTGINSSGAAAPVSAPVAEAQADAMVRAYKGTGRHPSEVDFVELHATGTAAGDPIEANWVGERFLREDDLLIGSVKGNIGHLEITAFLASLSKVCSIFETGYIPPNVNLRNLNPAIAWDRYRLRVPTEPTKLPARHSSGRSLISMTSSGIGGSNGHAVIEGPPVKFALTQKTTIRPILYVVGGLSPRSASLVASDLADAVIQGEAHRLDLASIYGRRSRQMTWRTFAVWSPEKPTLEFPSPILTPRSKPPVVFVFSGQGPQHFDMGRQLFKHYPTFKESVERMDSQYQSTTGHSLIRRLGLFDDVQDYEALGEIWPISAILPALAMVQMALYDLLQSIGVRPDIVVGHSAGETAVLYASGAFSQEMALEIAIARGIAMTHVQETSNGTMAAFSCGVDDAQPIIDAVLVDSSAGILDIACYNSEKALTLSGDEALINKAVEMATAQGILARKLRTRVPVHSRLMELCHNDYQTRIDDIFSRYHGNYTPTTRTFSCVTGEEWKGAFGPEYLWHNAVQPVLFSRSISAILQEAPSAIFIEVSPHPVLSSYLSELGAGAQSIVGPMKRTKKMHTFHESTIFLEAIGRIAQLGYNNISFPTLHGNDQPNFNISTPPYRFAPKLIPYYPESSQMVAKYLRNRIGPLNYADLKFNTATHPELAEHVIRGEAIMPAAGFIEMAFEHGAQFIWNIKFNSMMPILADKRLSVEFLQNKKHWSITSASTELTFVRSRAARVHVDGYMSSTFSDSMNSSINLDAIRSRCEEINVKHFYETLSYFAQYGPTFQRVVGCYIGDGEALAVIKCASPDLPNLGDYILHPAMLDACFHIMVHPALTANADRNYYYLPAGVNSVVLHDPSFVKSAAPEFLFSYVKFQEWLPDSISFDLVVCNDQGRRICSFFGFKVARHSIRPDLTGARKSYDLIFEPIMDPLPKLQQTEPFDYKIPSPSEFLEISRSQASSGQPIILAFRLDEALSFPELLSVFRRAGNEKIWIVASEDRDGFAARGFFRVWTRETFTTNAHLVIFHKTWADNEKVTYVRNLTALPDTEKEIYVDREGVVRAPRATSFPELTSKPHITSQLPTFPPSSGVVVSISSFTPAQGGLQGFIGTVADGKATEWKKGTRVVGIASASARDSEIIHEGRLISLEDGEDGVDLATLALPMVFTALSIGLEAIRNTKRLTSQKIVITDNESPFIQSFLYLLEAFGLSPLLITPEVSVESLSILRSSNIVISGSSDEEDIDVLTGVVSHPSTTFFWNDSHENAASKVEQNPWLIGDSLAELRKVLYLVAQKRHHYTLPENPLIMTNTQSRPLFDNQKAYLLVGGIGSLGIHIALWMYKRGARHIVLTSRSGRDSLKKINNVMGLRILGYLENRKDLNIQFCACDAASESDTSKLVASITSPLGGCILMSVVLSDKLLISHTKDTFWVPFASKEKAFHVLESVINIPGLDFLVTLSSAATFGSSGQTNYASANTIMDALTAPYPNAFSFIAPAVLDSTTFSHGPDLLPDPKYYLWLPWSMTSEEICAGLEDGIRRLKEGPFWLYVPDLHWESVQKHFGSSAIYDHLVEEPTEGSEEMTPVESKASLKDLVLSFLDVPEDDFSPEVPFTSYGLDSLSAGRMSYSLKSIISITQMQLLADMSLRDLEARVEEIALVKEPETDISPNNKHFSWDELNQSGQTVVKLVDGEGCPLILIHGVGGSIVPFIPLQQRFTTPLWAIQTTPEVPIDSIEKMAEFYFLRIKEERPQGPYRLGGFSASSLVTFEIARLLQANGDEIERLIMVDHFPMLFASPLFPLDEETVSTGTPSKKLLNTALLSMYDSYARDSSLIVRKSAEDLMDAHLGKPVLERTQNYYNDFRTTAMAVTKYLLNFVDIENYTSETQNIVRRRLAQRIGEVSFPITVVVADKGIRSPTSGPEWQDLGVKLFLPRASVLSVNCGHFDLFEHDGVIQLLEKSTTA